VKSRAGSSGGQAVRPHRRYDRTGNGRRYEAIWRGPGL